MNEVTITVRGITVRCALEDVATVTEQLGGLPEAEDEYDGVVLRPGQRRREEPSNERVQARTEEFRAIRAKFTGKTVEQVAGARVRSDPRKRTATT
jgi:hypothetical protein